MIGWAGLMTGAVVTIAWDSVPTCGWGCLAVSDAGQDDPAGDAVVAVAVQVFL